MLIHQISRHVSGLGNRNESNEPPFSYGEIKPKEIIE